MARFVFRRFRALSVSTLLLALPLPGVASAGWGNEDWGEMVWGGAAIPVPALSGEGLVALTGALVLATWTYLARRRRAGRRTRVPRAQNTRG